MSLSYSSLLFFLFVVLFCLLFLCVAFTSDWMAASKHAFVGINSVSLLPLLVFLFIDLIGLFRLCRNCFRLNDGFGSGFRWDPFGFSALSPFLFPHRSLLVGCSLCVSLSLLTEWQLRSRLSTEYIRLLCFLSVYFSILVSSVSSDCILFASLSLPTEWRL
jgi:hypothetical protein